MNIILKRRMRFAGHIFFGSSGSLADLIMEGMIDGKRDRGRQGGSGMMVRNTGARFQGLEKSKERMKIKRWET